MNIRLVKQGSFLPALVKGWDELALFIPPPPPVPHLTLYPHINVCNKVHDIPVEFLVE